MIAALRPNAWDLPLFVHVLGAMTLVGTLIAALTAQALASGAQAPVAMLRRFTFRTLLLGTVPAYLVMRVAAQWILSKEHDLNSKIDDQTWVGIGFMVTDIGVLLLVATCIVAWRAAKKAPEGGNGLARATTILTGILLVVYLVAMWAMTAKPGA